MDYTLGSIAEYQEMWRGHTRNYDSIVDIGHAQGGLLLMLALLNLGKRCVGVEYLKKRVDVSIKLEDRARQIVPQLDIQFNHGDARSWYPNIVADSDSVGPKTLVYMNNFSFVATMCLTSTIISHIANHYLLCSLLTTAEPFRSSRCDRNYSMYTYTICIVAFKICFFVCRSMTGNKPIQQKHFDWQLRYVYC